MHYQGAEKFLQIAPNISKIAQQWRCSHLFQPFFAASSRKKGCFLSFLTAFLAAQILPHGAAGAAAALHAGSDHPGEGLRSGIPFLSCA